MRVQWSEEAFADIERLDAFLRPKNPEAADRAYMAIYNAVARLEELPELGRPAPSHGQGFREISVPFGESGYVVLYFLANVIIVAGVRHQREDRD